jgi:ketosteroid isomerase-like protein
MSDNPRNSLPIINQFNHAFNDHDIDLLMALMTDDCVFENTSPPPEGTRHEGQAAVRAAFAAIFHNSPKLRLYYEEVAALEEHGIVRWVYHWDNGPGDKGHIRGVDILRLRDGKIAEKLSYVKG